MINDIYENCPVYETESFKLRLVKTDDAESLLTCYSDKKAVAKVNKDYCTSDFYYTTVEQMKECIAFWLKEYREQKYVRFSIIPKSSNKAIGTVEIFGGENGVLRIDIATAYDKDNFIEELLRLSIFQFIQDFQIKSLKIKTANTPERIPLLKKYGFVLSKTFRPELEYYERPTINLFDKSKGVAYCGLACCVCSENKDCAGCRNNGCKDKDWCKSYNCCKEKNLNGCWECKDFPCNYSMFDKPRVKAFAKYIAQYGEDKLISELKANEDNGIIYHYNNQLIGDYDLLQSEDEVFELINHGLNYKI